MAEFDNIVSSEASEQTVDKAPTIKPPKIDPPRQASSHGSLPTGVGMTGKEDTGFHRDTNVHEGIDVNKFKDDINRGSVVLGTGGMDALINERADNQGFGQQLLNMAGQAIAGEVIGGTIEGFGYLGEIPKAIDYMSGTEHEFGNFLTDIGQNIREGSQDLMPIYQRTDSDWHDSGWWASNGVSVASSLSMMLPSMAATKALGMLGKGLSRGAGMLHESLNLAAKMGKYGTWAAEGISQAIVSRHMENAMEASGVFKEQKEKLMDSFNPATGKLFTEQEASEAAGKGASSTYNANWAMLGQDMLQYLALGKVFNPKTMAMETKGAFSKALVKEGIGKKALGVAETFLSEGGEEAYQYYMSERGKLLSDKAAGLITQQEYDKKLGEKVGDKEMMTSAFWGGLGGNVFQGVGGATNELFKSKERRSYEDKYAQAQGDFIKERGVAFANAQQEVMKADQTGDPVRRQLALNNMSMGQALDALQNDTLDQHLEMLTNLKNMSPEETKAFAAQTGTELNIDLLKESVPQAIKQAQELRTEYMKHLNKFDEHTSVVLTRNNYDINQFSKQDRVLSSKIQETTGKIHNIDKMTNTHSEMIKAKQEITALKTVNQIHKEAIEEGTYAEDQKNREDLISLNNVRIEAATKRISELKANDTRDKTTKAEDEKIQAGFDNSKDELRSAHIARALISDTIFLRQKENAYVKTEAFQKEKAFREEKAKVRAVSNQAGIDKARKDIAENMQYTDKKKEELNKDLDVRSKELVEIAKAQAAQQARADHAATLEAEKRQKAGETTATVLTISRTPITDNLEDEFANEEPDLESVILEQEQAQKRIFGETSENAKIYSKSTEKTSPAHQAWLINGKDKRRKKNGKGDDITVTPHKEVYANHQAPVQAQQAIDLFNRAIKGEVLKPEQLGIIYDYLPLKVTVNNDPANFAFLSARLESTVQGQAWKRQDLPTRTAYINHMIHHKTESYNADVVVQYGGEVNRAEATGGVIPENNIADFPHLKLAAEEKFKANPKNAGREYSELNEKEQLDIIVSLIESELMYTNEFGVLNIAKTKKTHGSFLGTQVNLPGILGTGGTVTPLAGGIFLAVKKADGFDFPLKLNLAKCSEEEANLIIDLCDELVKAGNPNIKFEDLPDAIKANIKQNFYQEGGALRGLFGEETNPNIMQLIGAFVYMDASTKGKTSEMRFTSNKKENVISFSEKGLQFKAGQDRTELKNFLMKVKRKQFDIKKWRDNPPYRRYAIQSGLLNTDAKVNEPLFTGRTDVYISSPAPKSVIQGIRETAATTPAKLAVKDRRAFSKSSEATDTKDGQVSVPYIDASGKYSKITRPTEQAAREAIEEAYNNQESKTAAKTQTVVAKQTANAFADIDKLSSDESEARLKTINALQAKEAKAYFEFLSNAYYLVGVNKTDEQIASLVNNKMEVKYSTEKANNSFTQYANQINTESKKILTEISSTFPHYDKINKDAGEKVRELFKGFEKDMLKQMSLIETMKDVNAKAKQAATGQQPVPKRTTAKAAAMTPEAQSVVNKLNQAKQDIQLTSDGKFYENKKTGQKYKRVTTVISDGEGAGSTKLLESASTIGNKADKLLRDFFAGNLGTFESYDLTDSREDYDKFIKDLEQVKTNLEARGETILSNDILLHDDKAGIAGTVDLLSIDKQGNFRIYDVKTMRGDNLKESYEGETIPKFDSTKFNKDSKRTKYNKQLAMYRILLNNTYGVNAKQIAVMPIIVQYQPGATKSKSLRLAKGIPMNLMDEVAGVKMNNITPVVALKPVPLSTTVANEKKPWAQMSKEEQNAMMNYTANKAEEAPKEEKPAEVGKGTKPTEGTGIPITIGKEKLTVMPDGKVIDSNGFTISEVGPRQKLANKARIDSGHWKYQSVAITTNDGKPKGTYAVVINEASNTAQLINITPGSASYGNQITRNSPDGKKVMAGYKTKPVETIKPVETKPTAKPSMTREELQKLMGYTGEEEASEPTDTTILANKLNEDDSTEMQVATELNNAFNDEAANGNTEIIVPLVKQKEAEANQEKAENVKDETVIDMNINNLTDKSKQVIAANSSNDITIEQRTVVDGKAGGAAFNASMLGLTQSDEYC